MKKKLFAPPVIGGFLTTKDVALFEGVKPIEVSAWCRDDLIFPVQLIGGRWRIDPNYTVVPGALKPPPGMRRGKGRPRGSRNKRPYPRGVKRPRVPKSGDDSPPSS